MALEIVEERWNVEEGREDGMCLYRGMWTVRRGRGEEY